MSGNIKHKFTGLLQAVLAAGLIAFATGSAAAQSYDETVRVTIDFAKIVKLDEPASTVIVGNSGIVEASKLLAQRLVIHLHCQPSCL